MSDTDLQPSTIDERDSQRLRPTEIFELIHMEAAEELDRRGLALGWSGLAAGLSIGFSMVGAGVLKASLPDESWAHPLVAIGYTAGFQIVILGRQQLFTENTLTALLPFIESGRLTALWQMLRLWAVVLSANIFGALLFAAGTDQFSGLAPEFREAFTGIGAHLMHKGFEGNFVTGIGAGWMIAALVWILPTVPQARFSLIFFFTWLISLADLSHIIAGSVEVFFYAMNASVSPLDVLVDFFIPALLGNIVGGSALFALITYAQVRQDFEEEEEEEDARDLNEPH